VLDLRQIRDNTQAVQALLNQRGDYNLQPLLELDLQQRELEKQRSQLQSRGNEIGKLVGQKMRVGTNPDSGEIQLLRSEGNEIKTALSQLEPKEKEIKAQIEILLLTLPNLPSENTPLGKNEEQNVEVRRWGEEYIPSFKLAMPHWEVGEAMGILNFERSAKVAQSRFVTLIGAAAALERALINFMLKRHIQSGYVEVIPPF
jgi:seryl-tRNA synthetase